MTNLKIQISDYDSYQVKALNLDQLNAQVGRVPIVRVYGSISVPLEYPTKGLAPPSSSISSSDNKSSNTTVSSSSVPSVNYNIIVHVHNYYPYLYVDCFEKNPNLPRIIANVESALKNSFRSRKRKRKNTNDEDDDDNDEDEDEVKDGAGEDHNEKPGNDPNSKRLYVANVALCKATPMYGFNLGYKLVYKISLLSPLYKTTLQRLLDEDAIVFDSISRNKRNIYEAHIPYLLQFFADFNLFGCSWMEISSSYWRLPILNSTSESDLLKSYLSQYINQSNVLDPASFDRTGHTLLEIDIRSEAICNRSQIKIRDIHSKLDRVGFQTSEKYLLSLNILAKDIEFQAKLRGSDFGFGSQLNRNETTGSGGTKWSNQQELDDLVAYVSDLSRSRNRANVQTNSYQEYSARYLRDNLKLPTAYELIDREREILNYNGGILLMSVGRDIKKWDKLEELWHYKESYIIIGENVASANLNNAYKSPTVIPSSPIITNPVSPQHEEAAIATIHSKEIDIDFHEDFTSSEDELVNQSFNYSQMDQELLTQKAHKRTRGPISEFGKGQIIMHNDSTQKSAFIFSPNTYLIPSPPSILKANIMRAFDDYGILKIDYLDPHYDNEHDKPAKALMFANRRIPVAYIANDSLSWFKFSDGIDAISKSIKSQMESNLKSNIIKQELFNVRKKTKVNPPSPIRWEYVPGPPSKEAVSSWLKVLEPKQIEKERKFVSQLERFTASNDYKFSYRSDKIERKPDGFNFMTSFNMEIHCQTTSEKLPNPIHDPINLIFYSFFNANVPVGQGGNSSGVLVYLDPSLSSAAHVESVLLKLSKDYLVSIFYDEQAMVGSLVNKVRTLDPDILCGYEVHATSWGYVIERFREIYDVNLCFELSRSIFKSNGKVGDRWGYTHTSNIKIPGRHMLNIWRLLRHELSLTNYSIENVSYHLLHQTVPKFLNFLLSTWFAKNGNLIEPVLKYYFKKLSLSFKFLDVQEIILRNAEQSRLIGVDFYSNFYRGSQYKVESILTRLTKAENLILNSPSKMQVHDMRSLECIPLVMEPDSNFYKSPLVVLDFQSLYPSIMIAYNYCYSTLIGKLKGFDPNKNEVGYLKDMKLSPNVIETLRKNDDLILSPNGYMFVKSRVRKSTLAKMLEEILEARINVKYLMKMFGSGDPELQKLYNSKQLALKLIANVTYGYTSATFSGRMPNSDIADAIVATGRELLTQSIDLIEQRQEWGAKVVYGDTDSLFVYLPGKTKLDAFRIGKQISSFITSQFPNPVNLKFEKVYHPCVLLSKKRYVGYKYEHELQTEPVFDAKGIETIRRDGVPAQQIILERSLRLLFDTSNLSIIKRYVLEQFYKVILNKASVKDFCFAKEVRYGTYKNERYLPPGAIISKMKVEKDARSEPQYRERVPYLVIRDPLKIRLKDRCVLPEDFVASYNLKTPYVLDHEYYITKVLIPPLERIFNLMGVDIKGWYKEIPLHIRTFSSKKVSNENNLLGNYIKSHSCVICGGALESYQLEDKVTHDDQGIEFINVEDEEIKEKEKAYEVDKRTESEHFCKSCLDNELQTVGSLCKTIKENDINTEMTLNTCDSCFSVNYGTMGSFTRDFLLNCENFNCKVYFERLKVTQLKSKENEKNFKLLEELR